MDEEMDGKHRGWMVVRKKEIKKKKKSIRELLFSVKPHMAHKVESAWQSTAKQPSVHHLMDPKAGKVKDQFICMVLAWPLASTGA